MKIKYLSPLALGLIISGCVTSNVADDPDPQALFMAQLTSLCGQSFQGRVISEDEADADWRSETLTIHVRDCADDRVAIPLHVGDNRSRTWIISRTDTGLRLKHDHRHEDGSPDAVTMYGGDTQTPGTATQQAFPVDDYSKDLFRKEFLTASVDNVWTFTLEPGVSLTYALSRPNRDFRAEFDLTQTVETPPAVWGYELVN